MFHDNPGADVADDGFGRTGFRGEGARAVMTRRGLAALSASALALTACGRSGTVQVTVAQVQQFLGSALSIVNALDGAFSALGKVQPPVLTPGQAGSVTTSLMTARAAITGLQGQLAGAAALDTSTVSATLNTIDTALNAVVNVAASLPMIPPPYSVVVQAAAVLLPVAEATINPLIVQVAGASPSVARLRGGMSVGEARNVIQIAGW